MAVQLASHRTEAGYRLFSLPPLQRSHGLVS